MVDHPPVGDLRPIMLPSEIDLLRSVLACSNHYVEFGVGGSTAYAAFLVGGSIHAINSSAEWLQTVQAFCDANPVRTRPTLHHADIGPTGELGFPVGEEHKSKWPNYYNQIWTVPAAATADTYLVDGRFRVASAMQVLLHAPADAVLLMHDYANRPSYHPVAEFTREIARADNLSVFQRSSIFNRNRAAECLMRHALNPG